MAPTFEDLATPINSSPSMPILAPRRYGLVADTPQLAADLRAVLHKAGATVAFDIAASTPPFEVAAQLAKHSPDILFVEFSRVPVLAPDWMHIVCPGAAAPLVIALHIEPDAAHMITALRAGAIEFLTLPLGEGVSDSFERIAGLLETRSAARSQRGKVIGFVSAKGGCGATSLACNLAVALARSKASIPILLADLDYQASIAHWVCRVTPRFRATDAFHAVRRLSSAIWPEFVSPVAEGVDLLAGSIAGNAPPEAWRIEALFRFLAGNYGWVLADLGRQLTPAGWGFLDNLDELYIVTAPDVLALYQTRSMLQTLTSRGFDRSRLRLVLNRNESSPHDFWAESIRQMFEMDVSGIIPSDPASLRDRPPDRYEFPTGTPYGKSVMKLAGKMVKAATLVVAGKAA